MAIARRAVAAFGAALCAGAVPAHAGPYTAAYVFGDSLSDNGNLAEVLFRSNLPNPPSFQNSFTNGPVAAAVLANSLGLSLTPSLWVTGFQDVNGLYGPSFRPGTNYAVAGATAAFQVPGGPSGINLPQQVAAFGVGSTGRADPNALYVVDIGGNDVRRAAMAGAGPAGVAAGVQSEVGAVAALLSLGAKNLLVVNVTDVGGVPEFALGQTPAVTAAASAYSVLYNAQLAQGLAALALPSGATLTQFDLYAYNAGLLADPGRYGLTNTTTPCYINTPLSAATTAACGPNAENIDQFVYWDAIHPTRVVQALWARGFESAIGVPEPSSLALLGVGLAGLIGAGRRRVSAGR